MTDVTQIVSKIVQGDPSAEQQLLPLVYDELRKLAAFKLSHEKPGQTLQATALVHEAYLRLLGPAGAEQQWNSRRHFFAAAAEAMRRILVDNARRKGSVKHGGGRQRIELDELKLTIDEPSDDIFGTPRSPE
jgi:RNA polymerase sigma factor (TIGR02999 family)